MNHGGIGVALTLGEWREGFLPAGLAFAPEDRPLLAQLGEGGRLKIVEQLDGHIHVQATSWVGIVRFSKFEIHVRPKLTGDNLGLVALLAYTGELAALRRLNGLPALIATGGGDLLDLLILLFITEVERVIGRGLLADYLETEDNLPVVRGRLLAARQALRRFGQINRLECRFDDLSTDLAENQILAAALSACARLARQPAVRRRVHTLRGIFEAACTPPRDPAGLAELRATLVYHRLNQAYRDAHALAWWLLDHVGIQDFHQPGALRCFSFLLDMNLLFEQFVARWLRQILTPWSYTVRSQPKDRSVLWDPDRQQPHAGIIPDLLIRAVPHDAGAPGFPVDAKYKLYDEGDVKNADIYQTFLYAFAFAPAGAPPPCRAMIFHPASKATGSLQRVQVRRAAAGHSPGGEIMVCGVHLPTALEEAKRSIPGPQSNAVLGIIREAATSK